jgi:integrase/recombinase XerC
VAGKQAKTLSALQIQELFDHVRGRKDHLRSRVIVALSFYAGLRACELCRLEWHMVLGPVGGIGESIAVEDRISKGRYGGREIPMHPEVRRALVALLRRTPRPIGPIVRSRKGGAMKANSLVNWFKHLYRELGYTGASSHSGRRSWATQLARLANEANATVFDLRDLMGHSDVATTTRYVESDSKVRRKLISLL